MSDSQVWQVNLTLEAAAVEAADGVMEAAGALSIASFEIEGSSAWTMTALFEGRPEIDSLTAELAQTLGGTGPVLALGQVENRDWVAETISAFPPLAIGPFWVHGSHAAPPDTSRRALRIDAGIAFGSGEHATTEGCLLALARLSDEGARPRNALDMGCGSGILAIAAAMLFDCRVLAVDIDPASAAFAAEAAAANGCSRRVTALAGDGYATPEVVARAPYDLVMANILANPLILMAPALAAALKPGGRAILSGLLAEQAGAVREAHTVAGMTLVERRDLRGWSTLVMAKV